MRPGHGKNTRVTRASSCPLCSSATSVLAKSAGAGLFTIAAISPLTANAFIKGRSVMGIVNQIKLGCLIRQQTDAQKGLLSAIIISWTR
jgi:hypothetical protein